MPELLILNALLLVSALSLDTFVVAFSYGANRIKIPLLSAVIISFICSASLAAALYAGAFFANVIPAAAALFVCAAILLCIGSAKLGESVFKQKTFTGICAGERIAALKPAQAAALSLVLSIDSITAGFGAGLTESGFLWIISFSLAATILFIYGGSSLGRKLTERIELNLSWMSGVIFLFLGISRLLEII